MIKNHLLSCAIISTNFFDMVKVIKGFMDE